MRGKLLRVLPLGAALICVGAALLAVGCGSTSSRFRYVQAATVAPSTVDVEVDGKTVLTAIGFGQTPTYQKASSGSHKVGSFWPVRPRTRPSAARYRSPAAILLSSRSTPSTRSRLLRIPMTTLLPRLAISS